MKKKTPNIKPYVISNNRFVREIRYSWYQCPGHWVFIVCTINIYVTPLQYTIASNSNL